MTQRQREERFLQETKTAAASIVASVLASSPVQNEINAGSKNTTTTTTNNTNNKNNTSHKSNDEALRVVPRLCHLKKWPHFQGYGFNLHAERAKMGQQIGKVDAGSPAESAGLREGDRIVEVNYTNIANENHQQVVKRIRQGLDAGTGDGKLLEDEVVLLVIDQEAEEFYKRLNVTVTSQSPNVLKMKTAWPAPNTSLVHSSPSNSAKNALPPSSSSSSPNSTLPATTNITNVTNNKNNNEPQQQQQQHQQKRTEATAAAAIATATPPPTTTTANHKNASNSNSLNAEPKQQTKERSSADPSSAATLNVRSNNNNNNTATASTNSATSSLSSSKQPTTTPLVPTSPVPKSRHNNASSKTSNSKQLAAEHPHQQQANGSTSGKSSDPYSKHPWRFSHSFSLLTQHTTLHNTQKLSSQISQPIAL